MYLIFPSPVLRGSDPSPSPKVRLGWSSKPISIRHSSGWLLDGNGDENSGFLVYVSGKGFSFPSTVPQQGSMWLDDCRRPSYNLSSSILRWSQCQECWVKRGREPGSLMTSFGCWLCWAWNLLCLWSNKCPYCLSQFEFKTSLICSRNHPTDYT